MTRALHLLLVVLMLACLLPAAALAQADEVSALTDETAAFVPLPRTCGGGLPPGESASACCLFGYVFIDGEAVSGAKVTVISARGSLEDWTGEGPDSDEPYFRLSLSDAPLNIQPGDTFTIEVQFGNHRRTVIHQALAGAQQVDMVLTRRDVTDYTVDTAIWQQSRLGTFRTPVGIAVDGTGSVLVVDRGNARVQVLDSTGRALQQWGDLGSGTSLFAGSSAIAVDQRGSIFVADTQNHRVQVFSRNGTFQRAWGRQGSAPGQFVEPRGVAVDADGNVYVADTLNHRLQKFSSTGTLLLTWGTEGNAPGQFRRPSRLAVDQAGSIYVSDELNQRIQKFTSLGEHLATIGSGATLSSPSGLAVDRVTGNVFVADPGLRRIVTFQSDGSPLGTINLGVDTAEPSDIAIANGLLYIADSGEHRVVRMRTNGSEFVSWGSKGVGSGILELPAAVDFNPQNGLTVLDYGNAQVHTFQRDGTPLTRWGGQGTAPGLLRRPEGLAIANDGTVYIADTDNHRIQVFTASGSFLRAWGGQGQAPGKFTYPHNLAIDNSGFVYVADTGNHRIQKFDLNGNFILDWGGLGAGQGQFNLPSDIAISNNGEIYVADRDNHRIQKFLSSGTWVASWGERGNGPGQFSYPYGIAINTSGSVVVADTGNDRVQRFDLQGTYITSWALTGSDVGTLDFPLSLAVAPDGAVAVADSGNNRVQVWRPMRYTRPIATLVAISTRSVSQGQPITLHGTGSDSDETPQLAALEWFLDGASTPFATGPTVSLATSSLAPGRHTITLRARDTEGETSNLQSTTVDVSSANPQPGTPSRWTFLLYLGGDAPNMASFLSRTSPLGALYRLERAAPNAQVTVAALYDGPLPGGGDSFYYLFRPDGSFSQQSLGEVNMGDPQTLVAFARWGLEQAPADHTYLALADHADALDGTVWDTTTDRNERLTPGEIRDALVSITEGGARPIDVLHFDGCLMGLLEPAYQVRGLARYLVASENLGWSAFAYDQYRSLVSSQTPPRELALAIAGRYAAIVRATGLPFTIAALDLAQIDSLARATGLLADELLRYALVSETNRRQLSDLRAQVQKLDSGLVDYRLTLEDEYVDLDHWAELVAAGVADVGVRGAAATVRQAHDQTVLFNEATSGSLAELMGVPGAGYELGNARGLGIYYPPRPSVKTYQVYIRGELHFVREQGWDEYLAAGLTVLPFDPAEPEPRPVEPLPLPRPGENPSTRFKLFLPLTRR